jgi:hypothetical protein
LTGGDKALVFQYPGRPTSYHLDASSTEVEDSPFVIAPDSNPGSKRWILDSAVVYADATEADQGATGNGRSIKALVDDIGASKNAVICLLHSGSGNSTTYTLTTSETISSNIVLRIEPGAIIDGAGTLTINGPFEAGHYQVFGSSITVSFGNGVLHHALAEWWGAIADSSTDSATAINAALTAFRHVRLLQGTYIIDDTINIGNRRVLEGSGSDRTVLYLKNATDKAVIKNDNYGASWNEWFEVYGLKIDGNKANQSTQTEALIDIDQAYLFTIRDAYIMSGYATGIKLTRCNAAVIKRNKIYGNDGNGVYTDSVHSTSIIDNDIEEVGAGNYHVDMHNDHGGANLPTVRLHRNHIEAQGAGVRIADDLSGVSVMFNHFSVHRVVIDDTASNNFVQYNTFYNKSPAIRANASTVNNVIRPNNFISCATDTEIEDNGKNSTHDILERQYADVSTSGTGEDNLFTYTLDNDTLGLTGGLKITAGGSKTDGSNEQKTIKFHFASESFTMLSNNQTADDWFCEITVLNANSVSAQRIMWKFTTGGVVTEGYNTTARNTTSEIVIKLTGEVGGTGTDVITQTMWVVELL